LSFAPTSEYECPEYVTPLLRCLLAELGWAEGDDDISIAGVEVRPYWWGDCTCGYDKLEAEWDANHPHSPDCFHIRYMAEEEAQEKQWHKQGVSDAWDAVFSHMIHWSWENGYKDAPYGMAAYCDCPRSEEWRKWASTHWHSPDCELAKPNFKFGEAEIRWYKHVGRGMSTNVDWDEAKWREWFADCFMAINAAKEADNGTGQQASSNP